MCVQPARSMSEGPTTVHESNDIGAAVRSDVFDVQCACVVCDDVSGDMLKIDVFSESASEDGEHQEQSSAEDVDAKFRRSTCVRQFARWVRRAFEELSDIKFLGSSVSYSGCYYQSARLS